MDSVRTSINVLTATGLVVYLFMQIFQKRASAQIDRERGEGAHQRLTRLFAPYL